MEMTPAELQSLGAKLRTQVRGPVFDYIEGTLPLLSRKSASSECAECVRRRKIKAASMRRYRRQAEKREGKS